MEFFRALPLRVWLWLIVIVVGLGIGVVASSRLDEMRGMLGLVQSGPVKSPVRAPDRVRSSDDPVLSKAYALADPLLAELDESGRRTIDTVLAEIEDGVRSGTPNAVSAPMRTLERYSAFVPLQCEIRVQADAVNGVKAIPLAGGLHRLPVECWDQTGTVFYPEVTSLLPVVTSETLSTIPRRGVIGWKKAGSLDVEWNISVVQGTLNISTTL